jgi:shikimate kinase
MNIYLIGLPGSGKTTLGKELAQKLNYKFIDTDSEIVKQYNESIDSIFESKGEDYFRKAEQSVLHLCSKNENQLISTGGGLPCFFDNLEFINKNGISIYIDVPIDTLVVRTTNTNGAIRPMLAGKTKEEVKAFIATKKAERESFYKKATLIFTGSNIKSNDLYEGLKKEPHLLK